VRWKAAKLGKLHGGRHRAQCPAEAGVSAVKAVGELVVEEAGADPAHRRHAPDVLVLTDAADQVVAIRGDPRGSS
jgi:hypothetical protein